MAWLGDDILRANVPRRSARHRNSRRFHDVALRQILVWRGPRAWARIGEAERAATGRLRRLPGPRRRIRDLDTLALAVRDRRGIRRRDLFGEPLSDLVAARICSREADHWSRARLSTTPTDTTYK